MAMTQPESGKSAGVVGCGSMHAPLGPVGAHPHLVDLLPHCLVALDLLTDPRSLLLVLVVRVVLVGRGQLVLVGLGHVAGRIVGLRGVAVDGGLVAARVILPDSSTTDGRQWNNRG